MNVKGVHWQIKNSTVYYIMLVATNIVFFKCFLVIIIIARNATCLITISLKLLVSRGKIYFREHWENSLWIKCKQPAVRDKYIKCNKIDLKCPTEK